MKRSASQTTACPTIRKTFPNLWYPPTGGTRVVESRFLTSNPSIYRRVFVHVLGVLFVTAGYFPFDVVAIHLGSFGHVPSRLQLYGAKHDVWVDAYVGSNFEEHCFSRYASC